MNLQNQTAFDQLSKDLYDKNSPSYHKWLTKEEFQSRFAPTDAQTATVRNYLTSQGFTIVRTGPGNAYIHAKATLGTAEKTFQTTFAKFQAGTDVIRSNNKDISLDTSIAPYVRSISGLTDGSFHNHLLTRAQALKRLGLPAQSATVNTADPFGPGFFTNVCFSGAQRMTMHDPTTGTYPYASYTGLTYFSSPTSAGCGYTPADIQKAYGLDKLYKKGFDGTGQTVVVVDWCGSQTVASDANQFSAMFGLPPITSANFQIVNYPSPSTCAGVNLEVNLDVEWVHAIAPGAKIVLLVTPDAGDASIDEALVWAEEQHLGNVISGSFGTPEEYIAPTELDNMELICQIGATLGISPNFSTGDEGDFTGGEPSPWNPPSVSAPASTPYSTAVGGISLALTKSGTIAWQAGWGNDVVTLWNDSEVYIKPYPFPFGEYPSGGSGGGTSGHYGKPSFQYKLTGDYRQVPDISWLADSFTAAIVAISVPNSWPVLQYQPVGGTSLACPMFSALWAIVDQEAGESLGLASNYIYDMPANTITDIVPVFSGADVAGTVWTSATTSLVYGPANIFTPIENHAPYLTALYVDPSTSNTLDALSFGTDTSLSTAPGWDNMTGLGVPNPVAFASYFNPGK